MNEPTRDYCYGYMRGYQALTRPDFTRNRPEISTNRPEEPLSSEVFSAALDGHTAEHRRGFLAGFRQFNRDAEAALLDAGFSTAAVPSADTTTD